MIAATERLEVLREADIVTVQQRVARMAKQASLSSFAATKLVTAASELARNVVVHAHGGRVEIGLTEAPLRQGVRVVVSDDGPGISDLPTAMRDGFTSGGGLGLGLPGARRLVDEFDIRTAPGQGTVITITLWRR